MIIGEGLYETLDIVVKKMNNNNNNAPSTTSRIINYFKLFITQGEENKNEKEKNEKNEKEGELKIPSDKELADNATFLTAFENCVLVPFPSFFFFSSSLLLSSYLLLSFPFFLLPPLSFPSSFSNLLIMINNVANPSMESLEPLKDGMVVLAFV